MKNLFVIDRIIEDTVVFQNLENEEIINVSKSLIVGKIEESNVYIFENGKYSFSSEETNKRVEYIKNITNDLWN